MLRIADLENAPDVENPYSFPLDPFQKHAVHAINSHENVLVTAKTGSGKTLVGEYQIKVSLARGNRVFYTTPIKSLTNQKFHDLKAAGISVGIMTGDIKFCPDADVVVMTTEILCNLLYKRNTESEHVGDTSALSLAGVDAVIFDEVHYINNMERGKVWEECLVMLPREINLILLSATIAQPEKLARWLGDLKRKPIHLISTKYRIVPLVHMAGTEVIMDAADTFYPEAYNRWLKTLESDKKAVSEHKTAVADRRRDGYSSGPVEKGVRIQSFHHRMNEIVRDMEKNSQLPALFFVFSRKNCEAYATKVEQTLLDSSDTAAVNHIIKFHLHRYPDIDKSPQYHRLVERLLKGIAFHHSGLLPVLREIVEILFSRGYVKLLFATETFAVGINMPTKTVVITSFKKYDEFGLRMLKPDEYIQMAGRAGRRGKDTSGTVLYVPEREPSSLYDVGPMMRGAGQPIVSKMDFHYEFILRSRGKVREIVDNSFWNAQNDELLAGMRMGLAKLVEERDALKLNGTLLEHLEVRDSLEKKIRAAVNAERRELQQSLERWKNTHVGPKWDDGWRDLFKWRNKNAEVLREESAIRCESSIYAGIESRVDHLHGWGFIGTHMGLLACNVHTGHSLLMARVFHDRLFHDLDLPRLIGCIAVFASKKDFPVLYDGTELTSHEATKLDALYTIAKEYSIDGSPDAYWSLDAYWVDIAVRWMTGEDAFVICRDYDLYEGDFVKGMLKLNKLVEEWCVMATLSDDLVTLDKFRDVQILRGIVSQDSLYIRL